LDEVVVTAQRRSESLQDVALAVEAIDDDEMRRAGMESAQDLGNLSPALGVNAGGGPLTSLFVRGVGALTVNPLTDAAVAQNVDGVYLGRSSGAAGLALYDLERVELLKGPQGTLYGRNATGGVVNYVPQKPLIGENSGFIRGEVGDFSKNSLQGAGNYSLSDNSALRLSGNYLKRDGYSTDGTNDADSFSVRGQYLVESSDALSIRIAADYSENNAKGPGGDLIGTYNDGQGDRTEFTASTVPMDSGPSSDASNAVRRTVMHKPSFNNFQDIDGDNLKQDMSFTGIMAEIIYQADGGTLTIVPAYRESEQDYAFAGPGFAPAVTVEENKQTSLEARYATDIDGPLNGILGAFIIDEEITTSGIFAQQYSTPMQNYENGGESWAVFADGTYDMSDAFRLTAGVRYTEDEKYVVGESRTFVTFCGGTPGPSSRPGFITPGPPPNAATNGCGVVGNIPAHPLVTTPEAFLAELLERGVINSDATLDNVPWLVLRPGGETDSQLAVIQDVGDGDLPNNVLEFDKTTYRLGVEWDAGPSSLVYAGFSTGYRAGGVDLGPGNPTYDPELIEAYVVGSKNRFLDDTLQVNAEAFWWEYEDQQISYFTTIEGGATFPIANGDATIEGLDVDVIWAASANTTVSTYLQFLSSTYDDLELKGDEGTGRFGCGDAARTEDGRVVRGEQEPDIEYFQCAGNDLLFSPEFGIDFSVNHVINLDAYDLSLTADIAHRGEQATSFSFLKETVSEAYTTVNLDATLISEEDGWNVSLFVRNATDERFIKNSNVSNRGKFYAGYNAPQTFGVSFRTDF
jgi:iron complex outermembrane receptor protein